MLPYKLPEHKITNYHRINLSQGRKCPATIYPPKHHLISMHLSSTGSTIIGSTHFTKSLLLMYRMDYYFFPGKAFIAEHTLS